KNDGHYFCRAGGNRPDGLNEPVTKSSGSGSHDNISKAPKNFSGLYLYYHPAALLCRLIGLNFINWLFGSL
ncbi:TPA: hypothetical protein ACI7CK_004845, partial [Escherichia coli]|nr:hypothetical protein [Escherichia coli]